MDLNQNLSGRPGQDELNFTGFILILIFYLI